MNRFTGPAPLLEVGITAISGGSSLLASFDETGALRALAAPNVDYPQHIARTRLGVRLPESSRIEWVASTPQWRHSQCYEGSSGIVMTESTHLATGTRITQRAYASGETLEIEAFIRPDASAVVWEVHFQVGGGPADNAVRFEPAAGCLVAYHREHAIAVTASPTPARFAGGSQRPGDRSMHSAKGPGFAYVGRVWGRLHIKPALGQPVRILLAYGTPDQAQNGLRWPKHGRTFTPASQNGSPSDPDDFHDLYRRSLFVIDQLRDRSGALVAGPPVDPDNKTSGGYAFCWPRDGAYIAHALDLAGRHSPARNFFEWALRVHRPEGIWAQRYYADGTAAPAWSEHQLDETGTMLWALDNHLRLRNDLQLETRGLAAAVDAFRTIQKLASGSGWPPPTQNLWEDHFGQHIYTLASLLAAALAWHKRAANLSDGEGAALLGESAANLRAALDAWPTNDEGVLARAIVARPSGTSGREDFTADISVLGLSVPFQVVESSDQRLQASVRHVTSRLSNSHGRMMRYAGDRYRGGNPWPLATLWMAWYQLHSGQPERAKQAVHEVLRDRTPAGLLAEQIDAHTGAARWVVPLPWAHAWFIVVSEGLRRQGL